MSRLVKRLLLFLATLGAGALVYNLMRAEGERALSRARREPRPLPPLEPSGTARTEAKVAEPGRCAAVKKSGERCTREAQPGSEYCWQHG